MTEYSKGFDHGCDYIIAEIEKWINENNEEPKAIWPVERLLAHLKMEKPSEPN
jgi:hypothetical protein